jgi:hypothetical protein
VIDLAYAFNVAVTGLASGAVAAALIALLTRVVEARVRARFNEQIESLKHDHAKELAGLVATLDTGAHETQRLFDERVRVFRDMAASVYKSRTACRDLAQDGGALGLAGFEVLRKEFEMCLQQHRLMFDSSTFKELHQFKGMLQEFEIGTRAAIGSSRPEWHDGKRRLASEIDKLHSEIIHVLQRSIGLSPTDEGVTRGEKRNSTAVKRA